MTNTEHVFTLTESELKVVLRSAVLTSLSEELAACESALLAKAETLAARDDADNPDQWTSGYVRGLRAAARAVRTMAGIRLKEANTQACAHGEP